MTDNLGVLARHGGIGQGNLVGGIASDGGSALGQFESLDTFAGFVNDRDPVCRWWFHKSVLKEQTHITALSL